jgi:hypothetical protein
VTTLSQSTRWLAPGDAGVKETLATMARLVRQATLDADFVWWARSLVADCQARDDLCVLGTLRDYVAAHLRFIRDPVGVENVTSPLTLMRQLRDDGAAWTLGDCDDAATLAAALVMSVGYPAQFVALAFRTPECDPGIPCTPQNAPYAHVYTRALIEPTTWYQFDTTRPFQNIPPVIERTLIYPV